MSKKTPSVGLNFEIVLDKEKESDIQKIKRWISKQKPPLDLILSYLFSFVEKWYIEAKIISTMQDVDRQTEKILKDWEEDAVKYYEQPKTVETGVFGEEGWSISISNPVIERGPEESHSSVGIRSDET